MLVPYVGSAQEHVPNLNECSRPYRPRCDFLSVQKAPDATASYATAVAAADGAGVST